MTVNFDSFALGIAFTVVMILGTLFVQSMM